VILIAVTAVVSAGTTAAALGTAGWITQPSRSGEYLTVSAWNWTHWSPDANKKTHAGEVNPGRRWFYCWKSGDPLPLGDATSDKWVSTDDDKGNKDVYISVLYLTTHSPGHLPHC